MVEKSARSFAQPHLRGNKQMKRIKPAFAQHFRDLPRREIHVGYEGDLFPAGDACVVKGLDDGVGIAKKCGEISSVIPNFSTW
jgi:hypothetical protein